MRIPTLRQKFIDSFRNVTQVSASVAGKYWISSNGDLTSALSAYYETHPKPGSAGKTKLLEALFAKYADKNNPDVIKSEGIENFCHDIGIEPIDPEILVFSFHCNAKEMGIFTKTEFFDGLLALDLTSATVENLKDRIPDMTSTLKDPVKCKSIYLFLFNFAKEPLKKYLALDESLSYWEIILKPHFPLFDRWKTFCETSPAMRHSINRDLWNTLWDFAITFDSELDDYDLDDAWPLMIDEFVTWCREQIPKS